MRTKQKLERTMVTYQQLTKVTSIENGGSLSTIEPNLANLVSKYTILEDMKPLTGHLLVVREKVKTKLIKVANKINQLEPNWKLMVCYGYRAPEIQTKYFWQNLIDVSHRGGEVPSSIELYETVHRQVAVPKVAGHPTGGAVDVCLITQKDTPVDCGSTIYDLNDISRYTFSNLTNTKVKQARFILRKTMMDQGFAPFDGEWWHFSFGDKEWATYYRKSNAIYNQISLKQVRRQLALKPNRFIQ